MLSVNHFQFAFFEFISLPVMLLHQDFRSAVSYQDEPPGQEFPPVQQVDWRQLRQEGWNKGGLHSRTKRMMLRLAQEALNKQRLDWGLPLPSGTLQEQVKAAKPGFLLSSMKDSVILQAGLEKAAAQAAGSSTDGPAQAAGSSTDGLTGAQMAESNLRRRAMTAMSTAEGRAFAESQGWTAQSVPGQAAGSSTAGQPGQADGSDGQSCPGTPSEHMFRPSPVSSMPPPPPPTEPYPATPPKTKTNKIQGQTSPRPTQPTIEHFTPPPLLTDVPDLTVIPKAKAPSSFYGPNIPQSFMPGLQSPPPLPGPLTPAEEWLQESSK
jgi:hypothetical protein